jgi:hypothetical protein
MKKRIIWQNYNIEVDNDFYNENYPELTEDERYTRAIEDNNMFLDDE